MKKLSILMLSLMTVATVWAGGDGLNVGDKTGDITLKNIDGKMVSLSDYKDAKGFIVVFTCNHCPYAKMYEERLVDLDKKMKNKGYPVIAINPNSAEAYPSDSYEGMIKRAKEKGFTFPYLHDETQEVAKHFGATRTPHVYLLTKDSGDQYKVAYIGAVDNDTRGNLKYNKRDNYLENAIAAVEDGKSPDPNLTKAVGCTIKWMNQ